MEDEGVEQRETHSFLLHLIEFLLGFGSSIFVPDVQLNDEIGFLADAIQEVQGNNTQPRARSSSFATFAGASPRV